MGFLNKPKPYTEYFDHDPSVISETGYKKKGVKNGPYVKYGYQDKDKYLLEEGTYKDGEKHGTIRRFIPLNQSFPMDEGTYKDGIKNGPYKEYYFGTDVLFEEGTYKDGIKNGPYKQYDEYGNVEQSGNYLPDDSNLRNYTLYYKNGSIREKGESQVEGPFTSYYENGQIKEEGHFKSRGLNMSNSHDFEPDEYGDLRPGEKHGKFIVYTEDGERFTEMLYENGQPHGPFKIFSKNKELLEEGSFKYGQLHGKHIHYKNGKIYSVEEVESRTDGYLKNYYDDEKTKIMSEGNIKKSRYDGEWMYYDENGKLVEKRYYSDGILYTIEK